MKYIYQEKETDLLPINIDKRFDIYSYEYGENQNVHQATLKINNPHNLKHVESLDITKLRGISISFHKLTASDLDEIRRIFSVARFEIIELLSLKEFDFLRELIGHPIRYLRIYTNEKKLLNLTEIIKSTGQLEGLNIDTKHSINFGQKFENLHKLKFLSLKCRSISDVKVLAKSTHLQAIRVSIADLEELQLSSKNLIQLQVYGCYRLEQIPDLGEHRKLKFLSLKNIPFVPKGISKLKFLEFLSLEKVAIESNIIKRLRHPFDCKELSNLHYLSLSDVSIFRFPRNIGALRNLKTLTISDCRFLSQIPRQFRYLKELESLSLSTNETTLNIDFRDHQKLKKFKVSYSDKLKEISPSFTALKYLEEVRFSRLPSLKRLPNFSHKNYKIRSIDIGSCPKIKILPDSIGNLENLEALQLATLGISKIPLSFQRLTNLKKLTIYGCQKLKYIPSSISKLDKLNEFYTYYEDQEKTYYHEWIKKLNTLKAKPEVRELVFFLLLQNSHNEPFSLVLKNALLEALHLEDNAIQSLILNNVNQLNQKKKQLKELRWKERKEVYLLGETVGEKEELRKKLDALKLDLVEHLNEKTQFILLGKCPPKQDGTWMDKRFFFAEIEINELYGKLNPSIYEEKIISQEYLDNLRNLIWSKNPQSELLALEMVKNGGLTQNLKMDFIALLCSTKEKEIKEQYNAYLNDKLTLAERTFLDAFSDQKSLEYKIKKFEEDSEENLAQFFVTYCKRTGKSAEFFFKQNDFTNPYRSMLLDIWINELPENTQKLNINFKLLDDELDSVLSANGLKGNIKEITIWHGHKLEKFPTSLTLHKATLEKLQMGHCHFDVEPFPSVLFELQQLKELRLSWYKLAFFPETAKQLINLERLHFVSKHPIKIADEVKRLPKLTHCTDTISIYNRLKKGLKKDRKTLKKLEASLKNEDAESFDSSVRLYMTFLSPYLKK